MKTVYWAPWDRIDLLEPMYLGFTEPVNVLEDLQKRQNKENNQDNFLNCPAFVNSSKNLFMLNSPVNIDVDIFPDHLRNNLSDNIPFNERNFILKQPSLLNSYTVRSAGSWIFFCEEELEIESIHPYMHKTPVTDAGFYVPGRFDISQWFRPLEYAFQMHDGNTNFKVGQGDPLMYVNFKTNEKVKLQKFFLTEELLSLSMSCVRLKNTWKQRNLNKLYDIFKGSKIKNQLIKKIKENLI